MSDDKKLINFKANRETYETASQKLEHGELSEELRGRLQEIAFGSQTTQREKLREQLATYRDEKNNVEIKISKLQDQRNELERKIQRVEDRLDSIRDMDSEYNGALEMLESRLHDGERLFPQDEGVKRAANISQKPTQDVIEDLIQRNPDVPECAFELSQPHEPTDWREVDD